MTEYGNFPGVITDTSNRGDMPPSFEQIFLHLDEVDSRDASRRNLNIYIFEKETGRTGELEEKLRELENEYVLATGVVFPNWVADEIDSLESGMIKAMVWMITFGESPEPEDLPTIREHLD